MITEEQIEQAMATGWFKSREMAIYRLEEAEYNKALEAQKRAEWKKIVAEWQNVFDDEIKEDFNIEEEELG